MLTSFFYIFALFVLFVKYNYRDGSVIKAKVSLREGHFKIEFRTVPT